MVHAHAYFPYTTSAEKQEADSFRQALTAEFQDDNAVVVSAISAQPAGPHPMPQFEIAFTTPKLAAVIPWLMFKRPAGFSILVHPFTNQVAEDHSSRAVWIGKQLECHLEILYKFQAKLAADVAGGQDEAAVLWQLMEPVSEVATLSHIRK